LNTLVIGGGISGLTVAYRLARVGKPCTLIEAAPQLGGVIQTQRLQGCLIENGPDSFISTKPSTRELIRELGLDADVIAANEHNKRTDIWRKGHFRPIPDGVAMIVPTKIMPMITTRLLGWGTKMRMGLEFFRRPKGVVPDRSVAEFIADHYGQETVDYLVEPLLYAVYGGDPRQMSATAIIPQMTQIEAKYGSLTRGVLSGMRKRSAQPGGGSSGSSGGVKFLTMRRGMSSLVDAAVAGSAAATQVHTAEAKTIKRSGDGYSVRVDGDWVEAKNIVIATPAWGAADLIQDLAPRAAELLREIPYRSSLTVSLAYKHTDAKNVRSSGFGFLVPKVERETVAACTYVGNKFEGRVPKDTVLLRCFVGQEQADLPDEETVLRVRQDLRRLTGISAEPSFTLVSRWSRRMAQYTAGHATRMEHFNEAARDLKGIYFAGNGIQGVGIPDCIQRANKVATELTALEG
jgi:protoporphyrinogen/coproporphyrinogen III oxidase